MKANKPSLRDYFRVNGYGRTVFTLYTLFMLWFVVTHSTEFLTAIYGLIIIPFAIWLLPEFWMIILWIVLWASKEEY